MAECFNIDPYYKGPKVIQSYLKKLKHDKKIAWFLSKFTKRWFVLDLIHGIFYYTHSHSSAIPEKSYKLTEIIGFEPTPKPKDDCDFHYPFEIVTTERAYILYAESKKTHEDWCKIIRSLFVPIDPDLRRQLDYVKSRSWKKCQVHSEPFETSKANPAISLYARAPSFSIEGASVFENNGNIINLESDKPNANPTSFDIEEAVMSFHHSDLSLTQPPRKINFEEEQSFECIQIDNRYHQDLSVYTSLDKPILSNPGEIKVDSPKVFEKSWINDEKLTPNTMWINNQQNYTIANNNDLIRTHNGGENLPIDHSVSEAIINVQDKSKEKHNEIIVAESPEKDIENIEEDNKLLKTEFCFASPKESESLETPTEMISKNIFCGSQIEEPIMHPSSKDTQFIFPESFDEESQAFNNDLRIDMFPVLEIASKEENKENSDNLNYEIKEKIQNETEEFHIAEKTAIICDNPADIAESIESVKENAPNFETSPLEEASHLEQSRSSLTDNSHTFVQTIEENNESQSPHNTEKETKKFMQILETKFQSEDHEASSKSLSSENNKEIVEIFSPSKTIDKLFYNNFIIEDSDYKKETVELSPPIISPAIEPINIHQKILLKNDNKNPSILTQDKSTVYLSPQLAESPKISNQESLTKPNDDNNISNTEKLIKSIAKSIKKRISPEKLINNTGGSEYQTIKLLENVRSKLDTSKNTKQNTNYENVQNSAIPAEFSKMEDSPRPSSLKRSNNKHSSRNSLYEKREVFDSPSEVYQQNYVSRLSKIKSLQRSNSNPRKLTSEITVSSSQELYKTNNETARVTFKDSLNYYHQARSKSTSREKWRNGISRYEKNETEEPRFSISEFHFKGILPGEYTDRTGNDEDSSTFSCRKNSSTGREKPRTVSVGKKTRTEIFSFQPKSAEMYQERNDMRILKKSATYKQPLRNSLYDQKYTDRREQLINEISQPVLKLSQTQSRLKVNRLLSHTQTAKDLKFSLKQFLHHN